jgi:hypothetical protein
MHYELKFTYCAILLDTCHKIFKLKIVKVFGIGQVISPSRLVFILVIQKM